MTTFYSAGKQKKNNLRDSVGWKQTDAGMGGMEENVCGSEWGWIYGVWVRCGWDHNPIPMQISTPGLSTTGAILRHRRVSLSGRVPRPDRGVHNSPDGGYLRK